MVVLRRISECDELGGKEKVNDESSKKQLEANVSDDNEDLEDGNDETTDEEEPLTEFEDPLYELSQSYEMEPEYENMTSEQEAAKVRTMTPREQAEYHELTQFHQHQAEVNKEMTGVSKIIQE